MHGKSKLVVFAFLTAAWLPVSAARADDLAGVLQRLDAAARDFHTTAATSSSTPSRPTRFRIRT